MTKIKNLIIILILSLSLQGLYGVYRPGSVSAASAIRITEIMFDPSGDGSKEFLEFYNGSNISVSLAGWSTFGVDYVFPSGVSLAPGGYLVIARNMAALRLSHPSANIVGQYGGKLKGGGELVKLLDSGGSTVSQVSYSYGGAWPSSPKDGGPSLSLIRTTANESSAACWAPSSGLGGTPSFANSVQGGYGGGCSDVAYYTVSSSPSGSSSGAGSSGDGDSENGSSGSSPEATAKAKAQAQAKKAAEEKKVAEVKKKQEQKQAQQQKAQAEQAQKQQQQLRSNKHRQWIALGLVAASLLLMAGGWYLYRRRHSARDVSTILNKAKKNTAPDGNGKKKTKRPKTAGRAK